MNFIFKLSSKWHLLFIRRILLTDIFLLIAISLLSCGDFEMELTRTLDDIESRKPGNTFGEANPFEIPSEPKSNPE